MRLIASLTTMTAVATMVFGLVACAGNAPKKPGGTESKSANADPFVESCAQERARGLPPSAGCPVNGNASRQRTRPLPDLQPEPFPATTLPNGASLPGGGVLGR